MKSRGESVEMFTRGNRPDLVKKEEEEIAILKTYLS
ncbi:MAG: GatB/YqeY domain-containing protein [Patescibacteria group bacterium]